MLPGFLVGGSVEKMASTSSRFIHATIIECFCFCSLFLKPFPPDAFLGAVMLSLSHPYLFVFFPSSCLLWVCLIFWWFGFPFHLYFLNLSPGSSFPACH